MASRKPETIQDFCSRLNISVKVLETVKPGLDEDGHLGSCFSNLELDRDGGETIMLVWFYPDEVLEHPITPDVAMAGFREDFMAWVRIDTFRGEDEVRKEFVDMSDDVWADTMAELKTASDIITKWLGEDETAKLIAAIVPE